VEAAVGRGAGIGGDLADGVQIELAGLRVVVSRGFDRQVLLDVISVLTERAPSRGAA